jgi:hypothetical protein
MENKFFEKPILNSPYDIPADIGSSTDQDNPRKKSSKVAAARISFNRFPSPENARVWREQAQLHSMKASAVHCGAAV